MRIRDNQLSNLNPDADGTSVDGLYTMAMLAEVLSVPTTVLRRWHRRGYLEASCVVHRLCYFGFEEVRVARILAALLAAGCSLATLDRRVAELARAFPDSARPLAELPLVVEGTRLCVRRGESLLEPGGQILLEFGRIDAETSEAPEEAAILSIRPMDSQADSIAVTGDAGLTELQRCNRLRVLAQEFDEQGELEQAIETYRLIVGSGEATAEDQFLMADVLYRRGDLAAARERYYMAVELDPDYVEAWANLGCILTESGAWEQARTAFESALASFPEYADVHYHLANLLDRSQLQEKARNHLQRFLELAPASPWAEQARHRLDVC